MPLQKQKVDGQRQADTPKCFHGIREEAYATHHDDDQPRGGDSGSEYLGSDGDSSSDGGSSETSSDDAKSGNAGKGETTLPRQQRLDSTFLSSSSSSSSPSHLRSEEENGREEEEKGRKMENRKRVYGGDSRTTIWRKNAALKRAAEGCATLDAFVVRKVRLLY
jgi:hypothetical protein